MTDLTAERVRQEMAASGFLSPHLLRWLDAPPCPATSRTDLTIQYEHHDDPGRAAEAQYTAFVCVMTHVEYAVMSDLRGPAWERSIAPAPGQRYDDPGADPVGHLRAHWTGPRPAVALHEMGRHLLTGLDADLLTTCNTYNAGPTADDPRFISFIGPDIIVFDPNPETRLGWLSLHDITDTRHGDNRHLSAKIDLGFDTFRGLIIRGAMDADDAGRYGPFLQAA